MKIEIIATNSDGNCIYIQSNNTGILIDAGKWKRDLEKRLNARGINPATDIQAVFISHAHNDHIRGLSLANKYSYPVYATEGEWKGISGVADDLQRTLGTLHGQYESVSLGGLCVHPFRVYHNAIEPVGYAIEDDNGNRACVVFDTGHIDGDMLEMMRGNIYIIEANYDTNMLTNGKYDDFLKHRIADEYRGHLSNAQTAEALQKLVKGKGERIYITHLSGSNNTVRLAENAVKVALMEKGFVVGKHFKLEVYG